MAQYIGGNVASLEDKFRLARIIFSLSTIAVCTKIFGFGEKFVIAHFFGTGDTAGVYFASTGIVLSIIWFVRELMYPSLLPVFANSLPKSASVSGYLFRKAFLSTAIFLALIAVVLTGFPGFLSKALVPGFSESKRLVTTNLLRMLAPAVFLLGLTMVVSLLRYRKAAVNTLYGEAK
jgi:peptidoglycan biosynthesis protein MviN/MurJ (putative lipid II flippase)